MYPSITSIKILHSKCCKKQQTTHHKLITNYPYENTINVAMVTIEKHYNYNSNPTATQQKLQQICQEQHISRCQSRYWKKSISYSQYKWQNFAWNIKPKMFPLLYENIHTLVLYLTVVILPICSVCSLWLSTLKLHIFIPVYSRSWSLDVSELWWNICSCLRIPGDLMTLEQFSFPLAKSSTTLIHIL